MATNIIEHGEWEKFKPDLRPSNFPENIMFCRRKKDGAEWYQYLTKNFQAESIKMTIIPYSETWVVQAVVKEADRLFPAGALVLELTGMDIVDPQTMFGQQVYDRKTKTFSAPKSPVPPTLSDRQFFQALALKKIITEKEALAAVGVGMIPPILLAVVDAMPAKDKFAGTMFLTGTTIFSRDHVVIDALQNNLKWTTEQMDDLWRSAGAL
jgi:hypothetical protein